MEPECFMTLKPLDVEGFTEIWGGLLSVFHCEPLRMNGFVTGRFLSLQVLRDLASHSDRSKNTVMCRLPGRSYPTAS